MEDMSASDVGDSGSGTCGLEKILKTFSIEQWQFLKEQGFELKVDGEKPIRTSTPWERFLGELTAKFGNGNVRPPTLETSKEVLGLVMGTSLVGRTAEIKKVSRSVDFGVVPGRKPLNLVSGIPGVGKTRMLVEVAQQVADIGTAAVAATAVVACTFNNVQFVVIEESPVFAASPTLPIVLRLLHAYLYANFAWAAFSKAGWDILKSLGFEITLDMCLTHLAATFHKPRILLLVDECLRGLDVGIATASVEQMIRAACTDCDAENRSVVFSAMATSFLSEAETESARRIVPTTLVPLVKVDSLELTKLAVPCIADLAEQCDMTTDEVLETLEALAVGGLPRAAEFLLTQLRSYQWKAVPVPLSFIVASVLDKLAQRYSFPRAIAHLCVLGRQDLPLDQPIPKTECILQAEAITARDAVLRGWLPQPAKRFERSARLAVAPALVLSTFLKDPSLPEEPPEAMRRAEINFAGLLALRPRDLWEEFVLRLMILRSYLSSASGDAAADGMVRLSSPFHLFPHVNFGGRLSRTPVFVAAPLANLVYQHAAKAPPSPNELIARPDLVRHLFVSESAMEPGIDSLLFARLCNSAEGDPSSYVAVGIQCKWSSSESSTTLALSDVTKARAHFTETMSARGWDLARTVLVFLAYRSVASTVTAELPDGVAVAGLGCGIEEWLGPSLVVVAERIHAIRVSHGPYRSYRLEESLEEDHV